LQSKGRNAFFFLSQINLLNVLRRNKKKAEAARENAVTKKTPTTLCHCGDVSS
jgi:hypothetical protein